MCFFTASLLILKTDSQKVNTPNTTNTWLNWSIELSLLAHNSKGKTLDMNAFQHSDLHTELSRPMRVKDGKYAFSPNE